MTIEIDLQRAAFWALVLLLYAACGGMVCAFREMERKFREYVLVLVATEEYE